MRTPRTGRDFESGLQHRRTCLKDVIPVGVPSYHRYSCSRTLNLFRRFNVINDVYVFVRKEELDAYRDSYPEFCYVPLENVNGLSETRQIEIDFFTEHGFRQYIDLDDDITSLHVNRNLNGYEMLNNAREAIEVIRNESRKYFDRFDDLVMIGTSRRRFINKRESSLYYNRYATPRQVFAFDLEKLKRFNIRRNLAWNTSGDDIGIVAQIMMAHKDLATIATVCHDFYDDKRDSTIRNSNNHCILHKIQEALLDSFSIRELFRETRPVHEGDPVFFDINFKKYCEICKRPSFQE